MRYFKTVNIIDKKDLSGNVIRTHEPDWLQVEFMKINSFMDVWHELLFTVVAIDDKNWKDEYNNKKDIKEISFMEVESIAIMSVTWRKKYIIKGDVEKGIIDKRLRTLADYTSAVAKSEPVAEIIPIKPNINNIIKNWKPKKTKTYSNHSGTILVDETWAGPEEHIVGNVVVNGCTLTISSVAADTYIYRDGDYDITTTNNGIIKADGNQNYRIINQYVDRTSATWDSYDYAFNLTNAGAGCSFTYIDFRNATWCIYVGGTLGGAITMQYMYGENCAYIFNDLNTSGISSSILNSKFIQVSTIIPSTTTNAVIINKIETVDTLYLGGTTGATITVTNSRFNYGGVISQGFQGFNVDMDNCFMNRCLDPRFTGTIDYCINKSYIGNYGFWSPAPQNPVVTHCDIMGQSTYGARYSGVFNYCYHSGPISIDTLNPNAVNAGIPDGVFNTTISSYYVAVDAVQDSVTVRNIPIPTISNIIATLIDINTVTITWDTDEYATSEIEIGVASGDYNPKMITDDEWSDYKNKGKDYKKNHSVTIKGLASGTKHYFRIRGQNPIEEYSAYSAEEDFTTGQVASSILPIITIIGNKTFDCIID